MQETKNNSMAEIMPMFAPFIDAIATKVAELLREGKKADNKPRYYTRKELAGILHVSLVTLDSMAKKGAIKPMKCGGKVLYDADVIDSLIESKQVYRYKRM